MRKRLDHRGSRLAYEVQGQGPPVLLIQGVGVHGNGWRPQVEALADRYTCLTFDNRGMGESQPAGAPVTVEQMAEDALALLDAEGWGSAHVIGHSLGGLVALELALAARQRVRSLALLCTFAGGRDAAPLDAADDLDRSPHPGRHPPDAPPGVPATRDAPGSIAEVDMDGMAERLAPLFGHDLADQPPIVGKQLRGDAGLQRVSTARGAGGSADAWW